MKITKDERSLLLFFETCAVDRAGKVDTRRMNDDDMKIGSAWNENDFVRFGRIKFTDISKPPSRLLPNYTHWCELSEEAWKEAHKERRARAERMAKKITYERISI